MPELIPYRLPQPAGLGRDRGPTRREHLDRRAGRFFFFHGPASSEIYTLSLHDALPISWTARASQRRTPSRAPRRKFALSSSVVKRSEEHTSELQSRENLVCRLLLE